MPLCGACLRHARHPKSPEAPLRARPCPRFPGGTVHRGCCAAEACSVVDRGGRVRCGWDLGGRERVERLAATATASQTPSGAPAAAGAGRVARVRILPARSPDSRPPPPGAGP